MIAGVLFHDCGKLWENSYPEDGFGQIHSLHGEMLGHIPLGIELVIPDWFYEGVIDQALVLTIDPAYFALTGGLERWLYRLVRKHGGKQKGGWSFDFQHLHMKSGALSPMKRFAFDLRDIVRRQALPGYKLSLEHALGRERLKFVSIPLDPFDAAMRRVGFSPVDKS
jgi:plasmid replication initiation protein